MSERYRPQKVLLVNPRNENVHVGFKTMARVEPLGLETLGGAIQDIVEHVEIADDAVIEGESKRKIQSGDYDIIGITGNFTSHAEATIETAKSVRELVKKDALVVLGGHHVGAIPEHLQIPEVDAIVIGPGEKPFREIILANGSHKSLEDISNIYYKTSEGEFASNVTKKTGRAELIFNSNELDGRKDPLYELEDEYRPHLRFLHFKSPFSVMFSEGCPNACSFCSEWLVHNRRYAAESAERSIEKISRIPKDRYTIVIDNNAFLDTEGAKLMAQELKGKRLWAQVSADNVANNPELFEMLGDSGKGILDTVLIGIETVVDKELKGINKTATVQQNLRALEILRKAGIKRWAAQLLLPSMKMDDFKRILDFNREEGIEYPQYTWLTPLPGTPDWNRAVKGNGPYKLREPFSIHNMAFFSKLDFFHNVFEGEFTAEESERIQKDLYYYSSGIAVGPDGKLFNPDISNRLARDIINDIRNGLTDKETVKSYRKDLDETYNPKGRPILVSKAA